MKVWQPGRIGSLELDHRLIMGSMHLNLEGRGDHGDSLAAFYAERARGGASLIVTGGLAVSRVGAGGRLYAMINEPAGQAAVAPSVAAVHAEGGKLAAQLFHAGRYAFESSFGLPPVAPSAVYSRFSRSTPVALSEEEIQQTLQDFVDAARAAAHLGFDAIEVMASEGYLINQFVSPLTNQRDDAWGGDAPRRRAFPLTLLHRIKDSCDLPVIFRISGADLVPGSSSAAEIADFAVALAGGGVDAINVGVGWHEAQVPTVQTLVPQGIWVPVAESIKDAVRAAGADVPVIASNRINHIDHAEQVLAGGKIDFISMARPFLADPRIVATARSGRLDLINTCIACNEACIDRSIGDAEVSCLVNPRAGRELDFPQSASPVPDRSGRGGGHRVAVIGGGPAGLEAARALAGLGNRVVLYDAETELGGQFRLAREVPGKSDFGETVRYYTAILPELGVEVRLGTRVVDAEQLAGVDAVVLATGVRPRRIDLPGIDAPAVLDYHQAFTDPAAIGRRVAIIGGGGIAVDLAHLLLDDEPGRSSEARAAAFRAEWGVDRDPVRPTSSRSVTLMRRHGKIGAGMGLTTRWVVVGTIRHHGAELITGVDYRAITDEGVLIETAEEGERLIPADTVVVAAGQVPEDGLLPMLAELGLPHRVIGGAVDTVGLNAVRATSQGLQAAYELHAELTAAG